MEQIKHLYDRVQARVGREIVGGERVIRLSVIALLVGGHVLIDDVPGTGKTTFAKAFAASLSLETRRLQCTPDLLPSDMTGVNYFDMKTSEFRFIPGPAFTNLLLADEINRAVPRTQSALLEAMEERQVTIDGETTVLPSPFVVMATQNPVESESTFRLPAAQMDRFLIRLSMGYPTAQEEREMLFSLGDAIPLDKLDTITSPEELLAAQQEIASVQISQSVADYLVSLVSETRTHPMVRMGASPRASRALFRTVKAWAAMSGRDFVTPDDIQTLAQPVLAHRLLLSNEARISGTTASDIIAGIVTRVPVPPFAGEEFHEA